MIKDLINLVAKGESVTLKISALDDGRVQVVIVPKLGAEPTGADDTVRALRAALASPLLVVDAPEALEASLPALLQSASAAFTEARGAVTDQMKSINDAIAAAKAKSKQPAAKKADAKKPAKPDHSEEAADDDDAPSATAGKDAATPPSATPPSVDLFA